MEKHCSWTEEEKKSLIRYKNQGLNYYEIATQLTNEYNLLFTRDAIRFYIQRNFTTKQPIEEPKPSYKETVEIGSDGTHKSDKLLRMSENQSKDVNYLLQAHGYDVNEWELINAKNNIWNVYSKEDKVQTLYSSKITVKPKVNGMDWEELITRLSEIPSVIVKQKHVDHDEIYFFITQLIKVKINLGFILIFPP